METLEFKVAQFLLIPRVALTKVLQVISPVNYETQSLFYELKVQVNPQNSIP